MTERRIDPKQLMNELSLAELCQTAENYYQKIPDPYHQMAKPFASILEAPELLYKMGLLLSGLRLGKSMVVLDFGAGPCWFSRFLNQMRCITISVEVSETALEIGKRLFEEMPLLGEMLAPPQFSHFDGQHLDVPDESVDRIISFDAFHHVPNQKQTLSEFYRVLRPGGIVGFSEPGIYHSQTAQSQYEMRNYKVLENNIRLGEIMNLAIEIGFRDLRVKLVQDINQELSYTDYALITRQWFLQSPRLLHGTTRAMRQSTIFFLTKGQYLPDSRSHAGLSHQIKLKVGAKHINVGVPLEVEAHLTNTGSSKWLHDNIQEIGVVKIGAHLYSANNELLDLDFARAPLRTDVLPGQSITCFPKLVFPEPGNYLLAFDLVAEHVAWFENLGSQPCYLPVTVVG